ncbi:protein disulfide-isomerase-like protein of the testis [Heteronotia binoei]|uniref:protein disulfide-isomerase-like protein of the testis n=1 Tax=Heteronotia binoei TaxID=13085 RepID=UPI002930333C|nr:protein disulfide-isomerase-like protein of the testis [Heteronotia binoei]XP_060116895.1 protein disulfide-isomerase-like protein of the testis [Heteronotia binoei]
MMKIPWLLFLLSVGAVSSSSRAMANGVEPTEEPSEATALPTIEEEDNVFILKKSNFDRALKENRYLLVEFYIALSGPSQTLAAEFARAAEELKSAAVDVRLGKVDVTDQKDFQKEFNIQDFPTLKFFVGGDRSNPIDCKGVREASAFVTWVRRRIGSCTAPLNSTDQAKAFIDSEGLAVIGFLKSPQGGVREVFCNSAKSIPELPFGMTTSDEVFAHFGIREDMIVIFQKGKPVYNEVAEEGKLNDVELTRLIKTFTMDLVTEYNLETSVKIFDVPVENHILLFIPKSSSAFNKAYEDFKTVAQEFRGKVMFILVDTDESRNGRVIEYFQIIEIEVPAVQILNLTSDARYKMPAERVAVKNLRSFCQSYLEGTAKRHLSSEEIQEGWDKKPVKVLVGKSFDRVVFNKKNHVFVMFYAPWSEACQKVLPIWDELGKMYENRKNVVIAKIDYTANNVQLLNVERYPFFRYFPIGSETRVDPYKGEHTLEAFTKFLEEKIKTEKKASSKTKKKDVKKEENITKKEEL